MIRVVDLFAGCGGLAEGFAQLRCRTTSPYRISLSAERDKHAIESLKVRAFVRLCREHGQLPNSYFDFARGFSTIPYSQRSRTLWDEALREALQVDLGTRQGGEELSNAIGREVGREHDWILIGGPPCQAFSLVGRSRNQGIATYRHENDERYFLYRAYLGALTQVNPPLAFVLENVTGMTSAKVDGERVFSGILEHLSDPGHALNGRSRHKYRIYSLVSPDICFRAGDDASQIDPKDFVVRSEFYGVPQARHRVILVGIRDDLIRRPNMLVPSIDGLVTVQSVIGNLPNVRSPFTVRKYHDSPPSLLGEFALANARGLRKEVGDAQWLQMREVLKETAHSGAIFSGAPFLDAVRAERFDARLPPALRKWFAAPRLCGVIDHQARPHMPADLVRYLFCTTYSNSFGRSPTSSSFPESLAPDHKSWESGSFGDRFRVQLADRPATTITSHISKDGHYFIHPDSRQLRSLTVREAARIQTFPDDYHFAGPRTAKYHQVGNAVPPFLARQIADAIYPALK